MSIILEEDKERLISLQLQKLINHANSFIKLAKDKILEAYDYVVNVDGYKDRFNLN